MFVAACEELESVVGDMNNLRGMITFPDATDTNVIYIMKLYYYYYYSFHY